jgi:hypothetical protein
VFSSTLAACGSNSDDEPKTAPTKTATSAAPATTTPAPAPTPAAQPQGANGVTYEIQNWDEYATDSAVLAWKQLLEAVGGSTNSGKVLEPVRRGMAKSVLRPYVQSMEQAWDNGRTVPGDAKVKVESATTSGNKAKLVMCLWAPSTVLYEKNGDATGGTSAKDLAAWTKQTVDLTIRDGRWVVTKIDFPGTCDGAAP